MLTIESIFVWSCARGRRLSHNLLLSLKFLSWSSEGGLRAIPQFMKVCLGDFLFCICCMDQRFLVDLGASWFGRRIVIQSTSLVAV